MINKSNHSARVAWETVTCSKVRAEGFNSLAKKRASSLRDSQLSVSSEIMQLWLRAVQFTSI